MKKRLLLVVVLSLLLVGIIATPAMAQAGKADLLPVSGSGETGTGFVIFNTSPGHGDITFVIEATLQLKDAQPNTKYDIETPAIFGGGEVTLASIITDKQGKANFHANVPMTLDITKGTWPIEIDLYIDNGNVWAYTATVPMTIK